MRYFAVLAALVATALPALGRVETTIRALGPADQEQLLACMPKYRESDWTDSDICGGRSWFKNRSGYKSPTDCYDACQEGVAAAINVGASNVICRDTEGHVNCWFGFE
ncbi:hypothetical protein K474DRAFT_1660384 [Panus rudis PR-1116 ss-1]|nr:hypothetical protein K474DRAFT_1660384 [Panus rudis PR-1116 ss-1]